ncbi:predicted protein [Pyrenophora tritici-repentis Pt-1C-BFP]|uniref:Uncharacterized protein n=1 Tax=Pyrenophora tritici-repentis (strain Pt-1C-BFP) TaxID=426418 RepID=B2VTY2_PYRTR|nr:uncharacterized protein PTRG_02027 [Pyrenophora tritici-repentis Pt-1C-BFP]EDU41465.1 predicted protein [Pyrenophora tritici-repentis Pt-1C-BFP]
MAYLAPGPSLYTILVHATAPLGGLGDGHFVWPQFPVLELTAAEERSFLGSG